MKVTVYDLMAVFPTEHVDTQRAWRACASWCGLNSIGKPLVADMEGVPVHVLMYRFDNERQCQQAQDRITKTVGGTTLPITFDVTTSQVWKATPAKVRD